MGSLTGFMGLPLGSSIGFMVHRWVFGFCFQCLISCFQCFADRVCCFFGCRGFFSKEEEEEEETEVSWVSFVELECLKLEFHVNFNRNRVCDT